MAEKGIEGLDPTTEKRPIPQFMPMRSADGDEHGDFIVIGVPGEKGKLRRGTLLFSTHDKAQEFIADSLEGHAWQVRFLEYENLRKWFLDPKNRNQFDCAIIDCSGINERGFVHGFEIDNAIEAIGREVANGGRALGEGASISVESWTVFM